MAAGTIALAGESFGLAATFCFDQFVFGAQPVIEVVSHLTPSFLEQLVGAVSDSVSLGESYSSSRWPVTLSRMFFVLGVCSHDASFPLRRPKVPRYLFSDDWSCLACSRCATNAGRTLTSNAFNSSFLAPGMSVLSSASMTCW